MLHHPPNAPKDSSETALRPQRRQQENARYWTVERTAAHLGKSPNWFRLHRQELEVCGFPNPDVLLGYDSHAVEAWCDRRSGLTDGRQTINASAGTEEAKALAAILGR